MSLEDNYAHTSDSGLFLWVALAYSKIKRSNFSISQAACAYFADQPVCKVPVKWSSVNCHAKGEIARFPHRWDS